MSAIVDDSVEDDPSGLTLQLDDPRVVQSMPYAEIETAQNIAVGHLRDRTAMMSKQVNSVLSSEFPDLFHGLPSLIDPVLHKP